MIKAGPAFFETLDIPLLYGRAFDAGDRAGTPRVAVITERMARQYFGAVDAVGRRFRLENDPNSWTEVIGVVRDTGTGDLDNDVLDPIGPSFYSSYTQSGSTPTTVLARTSGDAAPLVAAMQRDYGHTVSGLGPRQSADEVARAVVACVRRPRPEVYPHGTSRALAVFNVLAPATADRIARRYGRRRETATGS